MAWFRRRVVWVLPLLLLIAAAAPAPAQAETDAATAQALMQRSGLWQQLAGIAPQARDGMLSAVRQSTAKPSAAELDRLTRAAEAAFDADRMRGTVRTTIARGLQPQHLPALERWYASPVGTSITRLEEQSATGGESSEAAMRAGAALLQAMAEDRRALLTELVDVTDTPEAMVRLVIGTSLAAVRGAASVTPGAPGVSIAELRAQLEAQRPQMLRAFAAVALAGAARTYESVSVGELGAYLDFLKSDAGRHFHALGNEAVDSAMTEASAEFGRRLPGSRDQANT